MSEELSDIGIKITEPGDLRWHSSDEDGGPDVGIDITLPDGSHLYVGELPTAHLDVIEDQDIPRTGWHIAHYTENDGVVVMGWASDTWRERDGDEILAAAIRTPNPRIAELESHLAEALRAVKQARDWFIEYEQGHRQKCMAAPVSSDISRDYRNKAERNQMRAEYFEHVLTKSGGAS